MNKKSLMNFAMGAVAFSHAVTSYAQATAGASGGTGGIGGTAMGMLNGSIGSMFANGTASFLALISLVKYMSYLIGLFLVINAIFKLSKLGTDPQTSPKAPIVSFVVGVAVFSLVGAISIMSTSLAMGNGPGDILLSSSGSSWTTQTLAALTGVLTFIRLLGYIAFVRGWLMINAAAQGGRDGSIGRGLTHLFGGVAAINIQVTAKILATTFAPGIPVPF